MKADTGTIVFIAFFTLSAAAQSPVVRARFEPTKDILVGQPVRLVVSVYVPNYFTGSPEFPEFEIDNAIVVLPQDRPENSNMQINGVSYAGITETYVIYPQQAGDFHLPPANIPVSYAAAPPKSITSQPPLPALWFHADVPAAAKDLDYFLPTTSLTIRQSWSHPLKDLRVGDSVERTITVTAAKMQAMLIPPLPLDASDGIRVYPEEPVVRDQKTDHGDFVHGRRTQTAKYLIQKEGDYTLPSIELKWWDLSTNHLVTAALPPVHFSATANPNYVAELPPEPEPMTAAPVQRMSLWKRYRSLIRNVAAWCAAAFLLGWIGWRFLPRGYRSMKAWTERRKHSEAASFLKLQHACLHNDAEQSYVWLLKWLAMQYPGMSLQQALQITDNPALTSAADDLGATLFSKGGHGNSWDGRKLSTLLKQQRRIHRRHPAHHHYLSDLNPTQPA